MEHTPAARFVEVLGRLGYKTQQQIADLLQIARPTAGTIVRQEREPSFSDVARLKAAHDEVNIDWIFTGNGKALGRNLTPIEDRPQPDPPADAVAMSAESHPDPYKHKYDALLDLVNKGFFGSPEQLLKGLSKKSRASAIAADLFSTADAIAAEYAGRLAALPTLVPFRPSPILRKMVGYGR